MIVPQYWAESRQQGQYKGRPVNVRRFGWSDTSLSEAQANADERAREALKRILSGEKLPRRDPKVPYNGAQGVPIREEIVSRHGETIITRNSYGARCLNTPNVLFADIDFSDSPRLRFTLGVFGLLFLGALLTGGFVHSKSLGIVLIFVALFLTRILSLSLHSLIQKASGGAEKIARKRIARFLGQHPQWNVRLYRTPAGMRVLVTQQTFSPSDPAVVECFKALGTDPIYVAMCRNQQCFRARVSAKPWRIGVKAHLKPRPGVWPIASERLSIRNAWIAEYEKAAQAFAACSFQENLGSGVIHPTVKAVQELHDELWCRHRQSAPSVGAPNFPQRKQRLQLFVGHIPQEETVVDFILFYKGTSLVVFFWNNTSPLSNV